MTGIVSALIVIALATLFTFLMWKLSVREYCRKMKKYIPATIQCIKNKDEIDGIEFVITLVWSIIIVYIACDIIKIYAVGIVNLIKAIMEVI